MRPTASLILILILNSCTKDKNEKLITGDLFFSEFRVGSFYNLNDSVRRSVENIVDTTDIASADSSTKRLIGSYKKLKSEGVLYKPYIDLKTVDNLFIKLYLDSADYDRIKIFKWRTLREQENKVVVTAKTREIMTGDIALHYCIELVDVKSIKGETLPESSELKIEDYN